MMWKQTGRFILKYRVLLLVIITLLTAVAAYWASQVGLSYEFSRAIPTNHPVNIAYQQFKKKYGEDGNMLVIGIKTDRFFSEQLFNAYQQLQEGLKKVPGVEDVISVPTAINLVKDAASEKLTVKRIFPGGTLNQSRIDSGAAVFQQLPFYQGLLYNPQTHAYLMGLHMNKTVIIPPKEMPQLLP